MTQPTNNKTKKSKPLNLIKEWQTWLLFFLTYSSWLLVTYFANKIPLILWPIIGGWILALHNSYQHEAVHSHPTRSKRLNFMMAYPPLSLWLPFELYRRSHLKHHQTQTITDPYDDPESYYWYAKDWKLLNPLKKKLYLFNHTFIGRMLVGPWLCMISFITSSIISMIRGEKDFIKIGSLHLLACFAVLYWVIVVCNIHFFEYLLLFIWPSLSLTLMRSYLEHRPASDQAHRTAIVEGSWITQLLFLNNNYHVIHHDSPAMPWFAIKKEFNRHREQYLKSNDFYFYKGYSQIAKEFFFKAKDSPVHPDHPL